MYKSDSADFKLEVSKLKKKFNFNGLYHFTDFTNLENIFRSGYLKSRRLVLSEESSFHNGAENEVIDQTSFNIIDSVRFYYKEKTPTLYNNEGIKVDNEPPHIPIPVYLIFDYEIIYLENSIFSSCNAASIYAEFGSDIEFFKNMDWENIFHRGALSIDDSFEKHDIIRKRNAELLIKEKVDINYLKKIVFRSSTDYKRAINLFGCNDYYDVDASLFNCHNNYIEDYELKLGFDDNKRFVNVMLKFHRHDFAQYDHRIEIESNLDDYYISKDIKFKESYELKRNGKINLDNFSNGSVDFKYYMNDILCIEENLG